MSDERSRKAIEVAERYADGLATEHDLLQARHEARAACRPWWARCVWGPDAADAALAILYPEDQALDAVCTLTDTVAIASGRLQQIEFAAQCDLVRDIFTDAVIDPACRVPEVTALAQTIYDSQDFSQLPRLADALARAGCDNEELLGHCRQPVGHVKGCWAVDLLLGKDRHTAADLRPWEQWNLCRLDCEPHRGRLLTILAGVSFGFGLLALCLFVPSLMGLPLGLLAWLLTRRDAKRMGAGLMDPRGWRQTRDARAFAAAAIVLNSAWLIVLCLMVWLVQIH
jgi:hypothetical protein